jgi:hypothetical protein
MTSCPACLGFSSTLTNILSASAQACICWYLNRAADDSAWKLSLTDSSMPCIHNLPPPTICHPPLMTYPSHMTVLS